MTTYHTKYYVSRRNDYRADIIVTVLETMEMRVVIKDLQIKTAEDIAKEMNDAMRDGVD